MRENLSLFVRSILLMGIIYLFTRSIPQTILFFFGFGLFLILSFVMVALEYEQMIRYYGYSMIEQKINSGLGRGTKFLFITTGLYIILFIILKILVISLLSFTPEIYYFADEEVVGYSGYENLLNQINEPKTFKLLDWIWTKSSETKVLIFNPNSISEALTRYIETTKRENLQLDWIDSFQIYCLDFLQNHLSEVRVIVEYINIFVGFNFWVYNFFLALKVILVIKVFSLFISRFISTPNFLREMQIRWELNDFKSKQEDKGVIKIPKFLLLGNSENLVVNSFAVIWFVGSRLFYPIYGFSYIVILVIHILYCLVIYRILKTKLESKFYIKDYGILIFLIGLGFFLIENLIFYYNNALLLGKISNISGVAYSLLTLFVFLYIGLTSTDKLQIEKIEDVLKRKDLELEKQKVQNQLIEEGLKRQKAENELIVKENTLKSEQIQKQILENKLVTENLAKQELENKLIVEKLERNSLETSLLKSQLTSLKNQIDEHFIANSLTFIGAGINDISPKLYDAILQLSDILRYNFETPTKTNEQITINAFMVSLEKEIDYIKKYLEFNQLRFSNELHYIFDCEGNIHYKKILRLILINYVENAMKHGDIRNPNHPMVIRILVEEDTLYFYLNNKKLNRKPNLSSRESVGNINTKQRLELAYPNKHELTILDEDDEYTVSLTINLS